MTHKKQIMQNENYVFYLDASYTDGLIRFSVDGYIGLMDETGKIVLPAMYDNIFSFDSRMARYVKQDVKGIVEFGKNKLFPDNCNIETFHDGVAKFNFPLKDADDIGFITENGQIIAEPGRANGYTDFIGGIAIKQEDGVLILMDKTGEEHKVWTKGLIKGLVQVRTEGYVCVPIIQEGRQMYYFVDSKGQKLNTSFYDKADNFVKGFTAVYKNEKWMILSKNGLELETDYLSLEISENGLFSAMQKNGKWGLVNGLNQLILPFEYGDIEYLFSNLYYARMGTGLSSSFPVTGGYFVINTRNEVVVPLPEVKDNMHLDWSNYYRVDKIGTSGLGICFYAETVINADEGKVLNRKPVMVADGLNYFFDERGLVSNNGYPLSKTVIPSVVVMDFEKRNLDWREKFYNTEQPFASEIKISAVKKNGRIKLNDFSTYKAFLPVGNGEFIVALVDSQEKLKYGVVDENKLELIAFDFDEIIPIALNIYAGKKEDGWVLLYTHSIKGEHFERYEKLIATPCGIIAIKNQKYGFIDFSGNVVIPYQYNLILQHPVNGTLYVHENGKEVILIKK